MRRALISVSDKNDLVPFVKGLVENDFEIISTGGTKRFLMKQELKRFQLKTLPVFLKFWMVASKRSTHIFTEVCSDVEMFPNTLRR